MPFRKLRSVVLLSVSIVILSIIVSIAQAQTARQIAQKTFPSIVLLGMEDANGQPVSLGSGFFVKGDIVATNLHVIEGASRGYAKIVGKKKKYNIAGRVGIDSQRDLVLLKITGAEAPSLSLGDSDQVAVGDEIYVVGNPIGLEGTFSQGIVSSVRRVESDTLLQITAPISPGSSGGPVLNNQGKVIGVAVATFEGGQNLNFAIPASYLLTLMSELKPVTSLSAKATARKQKKSIIDDFGGRSTEGVVGNQMTWDSGSRDGRYSFSLRNKLREAVKDVYCLVIFYDRSGNPLDVDVVEPYGSIPPGLAIRVTSNVHESVEKLNSPYDPGHSFSRGLYGYPRPPRIPRSRVEFRIFDFRIVE